MECRFCRKTFSKGEHLRRHERSHTGARPFVCKDCKRPFGRQDSLLRHERLHARNESTRPTSSSPSGPNRPLTPESLQFQGAGNLNGISGRAQSPNQIFLNLQPPAPDPPPLQQVSPAPELNFDLMWPDAEDLFQAIIATDTPGQWQIPLGTLPLPDINQTRNTVDTPSSFSDQPPSIDMIPSGGNHLAVHGVSTMITSLSSSITSAVESTPITSVFLDECLHMFFVRFIPTFPILHRSTFVFRDCAHPLLLNAIAIGSLYLGPKQSVAKGEVLWRLAHTALATSWQTLITHRGPYDTCQGVQLILAALLGQVYGALSKNRAIRTTSQAFHAPGFFWASQCGMVDCDPYPLSNLPSSASSLAEKSRQWRIWVAREIQQRALLAHYMLDGLISQMCGDPTSVRHASNQLGIPATETAFEADTPDEWLGQMRLQKSDGSSFRSLYCILFSPVDALRWSQHTFSAFSLKVLLEGLQSFISDCGGDGSAIVGIPTKPEIRRALSLVYSSITRNLSLDSAERHEALLRWHTLCLDAVIDSASLCRYVCCRYNIEQHIWANNKIPRPEPDLVNWVNTPDGRRALLHAVAIQEIVEQLPRGRAHAIHMPSALFAAATVYSVFSLAGMMTVKLPSTVDWKDALCTTDDPGMILAELPGSVLRSETTRYIRGELTSNPGARSTRRNLPYELNSMQKLFRCLSTQWGVAFDMEEVVGCWITLCH